MYFSAVQINLKLDKLIIYVLIVSKCVLFNLRCQLAFLLNFLKEKNKIYKVFSKKMSKYWKKLIFLQLQSYTKLMKDNRPGLLV